MKLRATASTRLTRRAGGVAFYDERNWMVTRLDEQVSTAKQAATWVVAAEGELRDAPGREVPMLTVVVTTRNKGGNVDVLVERLEQAWPGGQMEIVFVDDSDDNTPDVVNAVAATSASQVRLIHRVPGV